MRSMSEQMSDQGCQTERTGYSRTPRTRDLLGADGRDMLIDTVKQSIIPRLVALPWLQAAVSGAVDGTAQVKPVRVVDEVVRRTMLALCLDPDGQGAAQYVAELFRAGIAPETLYRELLTPVARTLGVMWEEDECSFADVTIGVLRLQNAQRVLAPEFLGSRVAAAGAPTALLLPVPGEQHTFGLSLVMDYFLRAGWLARLGVPGTVPDAVTAVRMERLDLVGLSFACDDHVPTAAVLVRALRAASANPDLVIMVGGPSFVADPGLAMRIGADSTALDGHQAVLRANEILLRPVEHA